MKTGWDVIDHITRVHDCVHLSVIGSLDVQPKVLGFDVPYAYEHPIIPELLNAYWSDLRISGDKLPKEFGVPDGEYLIVNVSTTFDKNDGLLLRFRLMTIEVLENCNADRI